MFFNITKHKCRSHARYTLYYRKFLNIIESLNSSLYLFTNLFKLYIGLPININWINILLYTYPYYKVDKENERLLSLLFQTDLFYTYLCLKLILIKCKQRELRLKLYSE